MATRTTLVLFLVLGLAACGGNDFQSRPNTGGGGGSGGAYTGLLIDAQRPATAEASLRGNLDEWSVVDPQGNVIFSGDQFVKNPQGGIGWEWRRAKTEEFSARAWLGTNPYEVDMVSDDYDLDDPEHRVGKITVSAATAADLRAMDNLEDLVRRGRIIFLVGKVGE